MNVDIPVTSRVTLRNEFPSITVDVPSLHIRDVLDFSYDSLRDAFSQRDPIALDLVLIAGMVYLLDKAVPRSTARDLWTREFRVTFPVSDVHRWISVKDWLENGLGYLTGDEWSIAFRKRQEQTFVLQDDGSAGCPQLAWDAVSLFSGGLDSLIGTIDWLAANPSGKMVLIGHHDASHTAGEQSELWRLLEGTKYEASDLKPKFCNK